MTESDRLLRDAAQMFDATVAALSGQNAGATPEQPKKTVYLFTGSYVPPQILHGPAEVDPRILRRQQLTHQ